MKYKQKVMVSVLKPFFQLKKVGSSVNRYRKNFRYLVRDKGSIGKAYQFLRKMKKVEGFKSTKRYLKHYISYNHYHSNNHIEGHIQHEFSSRWQRNASISNTVMQDLVSFSNSFNRQSLNIHWVIPDFGKGGGGHQTIFRMIKLLESFGHRQTVWLQTSDKSMSLMIKKQQIQEWYAPIENVFVEYLPDNVEYISGDVVIATEAFTAYPVSAMKFFKERFYFIQDNETQFYPMGTTSLLASNTYHFGFSALCAGNWLLDMAQKYGMWASAWELCADHSVYYIKEKAHKKEENCIKIAFYARSHTERRAVDLGLEALQELHNRGFRFKVYTFGQADNQFSGYSFNYEHLGILSPNELSSLYNNTDIGMVFSSTNYSLIPLEMMACGLPVVELDVESTRAIFPNDVIAFAKPNVKSIADTLEKLLNNKLYRTSLSEKAIEFASKTNWENSARKIEAAIIDRLVDKGFNPYNGKEIIEKFNDDNAHKFKVSVVIPTYNPSQDEMTKLLNGIKNQNTSWKFEVIIIDSSSTNGVIENLDKNYLDNLRIVKIDKKDFQHGKTRKYGAEISLGEIIVYTTQDAIPKNEFWLSNLIKPFSLNNEIMGVFGRHEAYENHDIFTKRDINDLFDGFSRQPYIRKWKMTKVSSKLSSPSSLEGKLFRCFFSDNNSAVRRKITNYIPYPEVDWGEDQVWANEIISSGFAIAYADDAIVIHSHEYDEKKTLFTSIQEEMMFAKYFGVYFAYSRKEAEDNLAHLIRSDEIWAQKYEVDSQTLDTRKRLLKDVTYGKCSRFFPEIISKL